MRKGLLKTMCSGVATPDLATPFSPGVGEEGRIVFRGLGLTGDGGDTLEVAGTHTLFNLADPPPSTAGDGTWVEINVDRKVSACGPTCCDSQGPALRPLSCRAGCGLIRGRVCGS